MTPRRPDRLNRGKRNLTKEIPLKTLADLFDGRSQLLVYHLMFGPDYAGACPGCSNLADHFDGGVVHLNHRDVTLLCISRAPLEKIQAYKRRMGWKFPWVRVDGDRALDQLQSSVATTVRVPSDDFRFSPA
jgi:predicted dithiol-disulfide oxidoreductase (DUF899 family)